MAGYDMYTNYSATSSRNNIGSALKSVYLEKYLDQFLRNNVDYHTFCNMTRDDLRCIGIINHQDQDVLLNLSKPMAMMYRDLEPKPVNWDKVKENILESSLNLAGTLVNLREILKIRQIEYGSLVALDTPSSQAILELLDLIKTRIEFIDEDLKQIADQQAVPVKKKKKKTFFIRSSTLLTALFSTAAVAFLYFRRTRL